MLNATDILDARILIVDDKQANVQLLEQMLAAAGYRCVTSTLDPHEVCTLHRINRYELILLDLQMPGMNGFEVMEQLKEIEAESYLPVLAITAEPGHKLRALQSGAKDFISKPFDLLEIKTRIHNLLEVRLLYKQLESYNRTLQQTDLQRSLIEEKLKMADRRKDEFLAILAHELRNPLAPISAAAALLARGDADEARVKQSSEVIARQVKHMTSLVDDLLDISRISWDKIVLTEQPLDVKQVALEAIEQVSALMEGRRHRLTVQLSAEPAFVLGDSKRLVQVMANLLNNAGKFTPEGGQIDVRLDVDERQVILSVTDNGIGMPPEWLEQSFELFAQAKRTSVRSENGLGLGLALVKRLVELHRGRIVAKCQGLGCGSEFTVYLPRLAQSESLVEPDTAYVKRGRPLRLMLVDDHIDGAHTLAALLAASGYQVAVEHEPQKSLARALIEAPDVCVLDIGLPDMDGFELARRLRSQPDMTRSTLIAISGFGGDQYRKDAIIAGFDHYFTKPIDPVTLMALLADISNTA